MKTQIKTQKGAEVKINFSQKGFEVKVAGHSFETPALHYKNSVVSFNSRGQAVQLPVDAANESIIKGFMNQIETQKEEDKKEEYQFLIDQLPEITVTSTNDEEKAKDLLAHANKIKFYSGSESEGLNLSVSKQKRELIAEAQAHCIHELEEKLELSLTADARKKATKTVSCCKCGLHKSISEEANA